MHQSVVKHRYWKGRKAAASLGNYTKYVRFRSGPDREPGGRKFFDSQDNETSRDFEKAILEQKGRGAIAHELILSPGLNNVDPHKYTRNLMSNLSREKGQELDWVAVAHSNTEHGHIHVLILGESKDGGPVRIDRGDHRNLREWGDRYLDRNHYLERFLDKETERDVFEKPFERQRGDARFNRLMFGIDGGLKEHSKDEKEEKTPGKDRKLTKEEAIAKLPDSERIVTSSGEVFTKYSPLNELKAFAQRIKEEKENRISKSDYSKLWSWIGTKEKAGDDHFLKKAQREEDLPPLPDEDGVTRLFGLSKEKRAAAKKDKDKEKDKEKEKEEAKGKGKEEVKEGAREAKVYDYEQAQFYGRRERGDYRPKGRKQRMWEARGRQTEQHMMFQLAQDRIRLGNLIELFPERREEFEKQLQENRAYEKEQMAEFKTVDLNKLLGWDDAHGDKSKDKSDEPQKKEKEEELEPKDSEQKEVEEATVKQQQEMIEEQISAYDDANAKQQERLEDGIEEPERPEGEERSFDGMPGR